MKKFNEIKDENDKYIKAENAEREKNEAKWYSTIRLIPKALGSSLWAIYHFFI